MEQKIIKSIEGQKEARTQSILGSFVNIEKAHVKAHTKTTKSGKVVNVKEYNDKRTEREKGIIEDARDHLRNIMTIVNKPGMSIVQKDAYKNAKKVASMGYETDLSTIKNAIGRLIHSENDGQPDTDSAQAIEAFDNAKKFLDKKHFKKSIEEDLEKAHVKAHTRKTKSGKLSNVKEHEDKRMKKQSEKDYKNSSKRYEQAQQKYQQEKFGSVISNKDSEKGKKAALKDYKQGWIEDKVFSWSKKDLTDHMKATTGAKKEYSNGYYEALQEIKKQKGNKEKKEDLKDALGNKLKVHKDENKEYAVSGYGVDGFKHKTDYFEFKEDAVDHFNKQYGYKKHETKKENKKDPVKKFISEGGLKIKIPKQVKTNKTFNKKDKVSWMSTIDGKRKEGIIVRKDKDGLRDSHIVKLADGALWSVKTHKLKKEKKSDSFVKIGYAEKSLLSKHIKMLKKNGIEPKILNDGYNYSYEKNRSFVVPEHQKKEAQRLIREWEDKNPKRPSPYLDNINTTIVMNDEYKNKHKEQSKKHRVNKLLNKIKMLDRKLKSAPSTEKVKMMKYKLNRLYDRVNKLEQGKDNGFEKLHKKSMKNKTK